LIKTASGRNLNHLVEPPWLSMIDRQAVSEAGSRKGARGNRQPGRRRRIDVSIKPILRVNLD